MSGDQPRVSTRELTRDTRTSGDMQYKNYSRGDAGRAEARSLARPFANRAPRRV